MPRLSGVLSALSDLVFKFIFGTEERKELLRELVNIVLARVGLPLAAKLTLRNPFNLKQFEGDKESILDIGATDETGRMLDIEVQLSSQKSYGSRALYYWSRQYSAQLPEAGKGVGEVDLAATNRAFDRIYENAMRHFEGC